VSDTLAGVRVLDLSRMLAGPYGSMLLADMGAEVIKVEDPAGGDPIRGMGPPFVNGESAYFLAINRNKRSVTLDLKQPRGRALFLELVKVSDVVFDNWRPGVAARLGVAPEACRAAKPDIITCSVTAFGSDGPYAELPAFDLIIQAMGGAMSITGEPGRPPVRMGLPMGDLAGGLFALGGVCAALFRRERTGRGQHIDLSLLDLQVSLLTYVAQYTLTDGRVPQPIGTAHQSVVPYQAFATADGYVVVAVFVDRFWPAFCDAVGLPALSERYPTNPERVEHRDELVGVLEARFREERTASWVARLRAAGVPCGPVSTVDQVLADPQVRHRAMVAETARAHPVAGTHHLVGNPVKVDSPDRYDPAPLLGEHNEAVYDGLLGLDEDALAALRRDGVI
jgi:crotonobetainyl-CoA:carnitine CoA-transferase CaiB-like acyl-CoA transferase